jgi:DNA-binding response OmpR family regulator
MEEALRPMESSRPASVAAGHGPSGAGKGDSQHQESAAAIQDLGTRRLTVLYAEDDLVAAEILRHRLAAEGFEVLHFENGAEALEAALETHVDVAILDVKMPRMDGFELLQRLRREPKYEALPVMMLTTMSRKEDIGRGYDLGADDYMLKPASPVEVLDRMRKLLER